MDEAEERRQRYASLHEDLDSKVAQASTDKVFFDMMEMDKHDIGRHYGVGLASVVRGEKVQVVLVNKPRGAGSRLHTHPNEQFNFVIKGHLKYKIGDQEGVAGPGQLLYIPPDVEHWTRTTTEEDALYLAAKDTSYFSSGDPVDTTQFGGYYEPGFEPKG